MDVRPRIIRAAGGLVWRQGESGAIEIVVVHRPAYGDWSLPKGKLHRGESEQNAALREVEEETGLHCRLGPEVAITSYDDARGRPKTVRYWTMTPMGGALAPANEVDDARWVTLAEAGTLLSHVRDRELLARFEASRVARDCDQHRTTVYLIRHAKAGNRHQWRGPDRLRPLTKVGLRQADALVALADSQPFSRLFSSPSVRCVQTLEPLARELGLPIETADELAEGAGTGGALQLALTIAADGPAAFSTHGDVVTHVVEALLADGVPMEGALEHEKGSAWILEVRDGVFTSGRYFPPPRVFAAEI